MTAALAWVVVGLAVVLAGVVAGQLGLLAYVIRRPYVTSDKLDAARLEATTAVQAMADLRAAAAAETERLQDQVDILGDEQRMLLTELEAEKKAHRNDQANLSFVTRQRDEILASIKNDPSGVAAAAMADRIRAELRQLQAQAAAAAVPGVPPPTPAPGGRR